MKTKTMILLTLLVSSSPANAQPSSLPNAQRQAPSASLTNSLQMKMQFIPAGHFPMGANGERKLNEQVFAKDHLEVLSNSMPAHPVFITRPFYLGVHEVTVGQFSQFVKEMNYVTTGEKSGDGIVGWHKRDDQPDRWRRTRRMAKFNWKTVGFEQTEDHPVVGVSWDDAQAFCQWLSKKEGVKYRLPTEAEWEYACRAGTLTCFSFGDEFRGVMHKYANHADATLEAAHERAASMIWFVGDMADGTVFTNPVGKYQPNAWGLHDMHGNVWEWCQDLYHESYYARYNKTSPTEPRVARAFDPVNKDEPWNDVGNWRTIRGGAWCNAPSRCRSDRRIYFEQADGACYIGFRVVREAPADVVTEARAAFEKQEQARDAITKMQGTSWDPFYGNDDLSLQLTVRNPTPELTKLLPLVPRITRLIVNFPPNQFSPELIAAIGKMPQLRQLILNIGYKDTAEAYSALEGLANLEDIYLSEGTAFGPAQLKEFACLKKLRGLTIGNPNLTSEQVKTLQGLSFPKLRRLNLGGSCDGTELVVFAESPLESLWLRTLSDDGIAVVKTFDRLESLSVNQPKITAAGVKSLAELKNVKRLDLSQLNQVSDAGFVPLGGMTGLRTLSLNGSGAGDATSRAIRELPLQYLTIGSPALTDAGMKYLGGMTALSETLAIGREAKVTDAGLKHLWGPNRLRELILRPEKGITGKGFATLSHELIGLRIVRIASMDLTDDGLRFLGLLPMLEEVELGSHDSGFPTAITDAGLLALGEAPKLKRLRLKTGESRKITEAGIAALKAQIPNLKVEDW